MTTHTSTAAGASQCDLILAELKRHDGQWVSLTRLHAASASMAVHSRIADLRARGLTIEQRNQRKGRMTHSSYRLITKPVQLPLF